MNVPAWTTQAAPRAKHLLHAVGLEPRPSTPRRLLSISSWSWFGAGLVVGAGLALLLTQSPALGAASRGDGHDTRGAA